MEGNNPIKYSDLIKPDSSVSDLIAQLKELQRTYTEMQKSITDEARKVAKSLDAATGATEKGRNATKQAATDAERLAKAQKALDDAQSDAAMELARINAARKEANDIVKLTEKLNRSAEGSYNRLSAQYSLNKIRLNAMSKEMRQNTEEGRELEQQTKEIYEEMKRLQEATGKHQLNVGNYPELNAQIVSLSDNLTDLLGLNNQFGQSLLALGRGGDEAVGVFTAMKSGAQALGKTLLGLLANPVFLAIAGIAGAGAAFKWWYDYNVGLIKATRLTQQFTGKQGEDLKAYRNEVAAVADTFDAEFNEVLMTANNISKQFGISANEALTIVKDGLVAGGNANGEFFDTLKEYPAFFKEAGLSADEFVAIVAQTNQAGVFSDKGIDAIKEASISLREMTTSTSDALKGIGIDSARVQEELRSGTKTTFDIIREISARMGELPATSAEVGTAIADIFRGAGEDAGLQYLLTLKDIETNLGAVKEEAGLLGQLQEEQLQSQIELQNALSGLFDATGGSFENLTTRARVFINKGLTRIIYGVVDLINYFIELYNESLPIRAIWASITMQFRTTFDVIGNILKMFVEELKGIGQIIKGVFTFNFDDVSAGAERFSQAIVNMAKETAKDVKENFQQAQEDMQNRVEPITIPVVTESADEDVVVTPDGTGGGGTGGKAETDAERKARVKAEQEAAKAAEEAYKRKLEAQRRYEDAIIEMEQDEYERRRLQATVRYTREIEDKRRELSKLGKDEIEMREALNAEILLLESQMSTEIEKVFADRDAAILKAEQEATEKRLKAATKGSQDELTLQLELARIKRDIAITTGAMTIEEATTAFNEEAAALIKANAEASALEWKKAVDSAFSTVTQTVGKWSSSGSQAMSQIKDIFGTKFGDKTLAESLGLSEQAVSSIAMAGGAVIGTLQDIAAARVAAADKAREAADREIEIAQNALQIELDARAAGYASNVESARKELELAKRTQQQAIKQQQRAQRQQVAIDTLAQTSSLITAAAGIWAQLKFPWAIPAIATMFASFAASKVMALNATKTEAYGDGTVEMLQGGSHQSGNDIDLGRKPDGTRRRAEGGEFFAVINKRSSRRYRGIIPDLINSLNNGTFAERYGKAYAGADGLTFNVQNSPDLGDLSRDVRAIKEQGNRRTIVDKNGNTIEIYKNTRKKIKQ